MAESFIIAIDGPSAAGKGTLARKLAAHYDFAHLDTGALYRAVAYLLPDPDREIVPVDDLLKAVAQLTPALLAHPDLRSEQIGKRASRFSAVPQLRDALTEWQRQFAHDPPGMKKGAVLDGRDIGTVICPDAPVKFFVTASVEARAARRYKELQDRGRGAIYAQVLQDIEVRDARDRDRAVSPLRPAEDAQLIDSSALSAEEVFALAKTKIDRVRAGNP